MNTNALVTRPRLAAIDGRQMVMRTMDVERLIEEDHPARAIGELGGRLDLSRYYAVVAAVEGRAGREHTDPQVLISLWPYADSRGMSSAREMARRCEDEPAFQWLCALEPIRHRTLSGFRSDPHAALDNLLVQVLGTLSAEGRITLERGTRDGTKTRRRPAATRSAARRRWKLTGNWRASKGGGWRKQAAAEEQMAQRQVAARRRAAIGNAGAVCRLRCASEPGALAARKKGRWRQFCGARLPHRPGGPRHEKGRGRH